VSKSFKYVGPYEEVDCPALNRTIKQGEVVEVEDEAIAAGLVGQDTWEPVRAKTVKSTEKQEG
jgi:hypothetical protein